MSPCFTPNSDPTRRASDVNSAIFPFHRTISAYAASELEQRQKTSYPSQ